MPRPQAHLDVDQFLQGGEEERVVRRRQTVLDGRPTALAPALLETAPGITVKEVLAATEAELVVAENVVPMAI